MLYVALLVFIGMQIQKYSSSKSANNELLSEKQKIALTARFVFMENCTHIAQEFTNESKNSLFQSKEFMKLSTHCAQQAEKVSNYILSQKDENVSSDNIVNLIDKALGAVTNDEDSVGVSSQEDLNNENQDSKINSDYTFI